MSVPTFDYESFVHCLDFDLRSVPGYSGSGVRQLPPELVSVPAFAATSLREKILSKCIDQIDPCADERAFDLFYRMNLRCSLPVWRFASHPLFPEIKERVKDKMYKFFTYGDYPWVLLSEESILGSLDTGKGSARGTLHTSFYNKLAKGSQYFSSEVCRDLYQNFADTHNSTWARAQKLAFSKYGSAGTMDASKILAVPKKREISRTICVEPNGAMMFQKGIANLLERRLKECYGIDLQCQQDLNRVLAQKGSLIATQTFDHSHGYGTIDLSSASDTIPLELIKELVPAQAFRWLSNVRTPCVDGLRNQKTQLHMISSMGNAFTFPLQTLLFTTIVTSCLEVMGITPYASASNPARCSYSVFGDDIIVASRAYRFTCQMLEEFGFIVNRDKSFIDGFFRESCGCDFFQGSQVRPVYIKSMQTLQDRFVALNLISRWGARHGINLTRTLFFIMASIPIRDRVIVPMYEDFTSGIHVAYGSTSFPKGMHHCSLPACHPPLRTIKNAHDGMAMGLGDICGASYYQYTAFKPQVVGIPIGIEDEDNEENPYASYLAVLRGDARGNMLVERSTSRPTYVRHTLETPGWGTEGVQPVPFSSVGYQSLARWQTDNLLIEAIRL